MVTDQKEKFLSFFKKLYYFFREVSALCRFFAIPSQNRPLVFYSERSIYYQTYEGFIGELLKKTNGLNIYYISSDPEDICFRFDEPRIRSFYVNQLLAFFILFLDSKVLVLTMPDLHRFHIQRSIRGAHHVYVFHAMVSSHMIYRKAAFWYYDTIFCVGPHHEEEIQKTPRSEGAPPQELKQIGYPLLDRIYKEHQKNLENATANPLSPLKILIAPSWAKGNILESCIDKILSLLSEGCQVTVRPHPEYVKRHGAGYLKLIRQYETVSHVNFDTNPLPVSAIHEADVLITDWSGIALEYALGTERPVLFIDTPRKVTNAEYLKIGLEPVEVQIRDKIGLRLALDELESLPDCVRHLKDQREAYTENIRAWRNRVVFNLGSSAEMGAAELLRLARFTCK